VRHVDPVASRVRAGKPGVGERASLLEERRARATPYSSRSMKTKAVGVTTAVACPSRRTLTSAAVA